MILSRSNFGESEGEREGESERISCHSYKNMKVSLYLQSSVKRTHFQILVEIMQCVK